MKIVLTRDDKFFDPEYKIVTLNSIDFDCCDAECTNIYVNFFLGLVNFKQIHPVLEKITSKLRLGGEIVIQDVDIELLAYQLARGIINVGDFNEILFASSTLMSAINVDILCEMLQSLGIKITHREIINNKSFVLKGVRC